MTTTQLNALFGTVLGGNTFDQKPQDQITSAGNRNAQIPPEYAAEAGDERLQVEVNKAYPPEKNPPSSPDIPMPHQGPATSAEHSQRPSASAEKSEKQTATPPAAQTLSGGQWAAIIGIGLIILIIWFTSVYLAYSCTKTDGFWFWSNLLLPGVSGSIYFLIALLSPESLGKCNWHNRMKNGVPSRLVYSN